MARPELDRVIDGRQRNLELEEDQVAALEVVAGTVDVFRHQPVVRALDDQDAVLPGWLDEDRRDPARQAGDLLDVPRVDAETLEVADGVVAEEIVADLAHHHHLGAKARRGDRLVGALAAAAHGEGRGGYGLARPRHAVDIGDEVDHVAADHADLPRHSPFPGSFLARASICRMMSDPRA